jgi:antitoxin Phd
MITVTSVEAQNNLGQLLDTAQREPVIITRHGRPAAYLISPHDMKEFQEARARSGQGKSARDWATASALAWNEFDTRFGSFADEHSTLSTFYAVRPSSQQGESEKKHFPVVVIQSAI